MRQPEEQWKSTRQKANAVDALFSHMEGPLAVVLQCSMCKHFELVRKGLRGVGRGYGMREGNKARGRIIQHIKSAHPAEYEKARAA